MQTQNSSNPLQKIDSKPGSADVTFTYEYDASGNLIKETIDTDGDGAVDATVVFTYEYDDNGNQTQKSYASSENGAPYRIDSYEYDADGNQTKVSIDYDPSDDLPNEVYEYEYDANGNQIKALSDFNGDGLEVRVDEYEYDADGNALKQSSDYDGDGTIDDVREYSYQYDAANNLVESSYDNSGDGLPDSITQYEYDANNNQTKVSVDQGGDGTTDSITQYEYDADSNLVKESIDADADGVAERTTTYVYTADETQPTEPEVVDPEIEDPVVVDPEVVEPEVVDPVVDSPITDGPVVVDPVVVEPEVTDPEVVDPVVDNPIVDGPIVDGPIVDGPEVTDPVVDGPVVVDGPDIDSPVVVDPVIDSPEVLAPETAKSLQLNLEDLGLEGVGELRIFNLEADGSKTQLASFFVLEDGKLSNDYSSDLSMDSSLLSAGDQLQFELVENGRVRTGTLDIQDGITSVLDFGDNARLTASLVSEAAAPNLLRADATTLDLTGFDGSDVTLNFSVYREASYDSTLGFYRTDDANGGIKDAMTGEMLQPGDDGYQEAALSRQLDVQLSGQNGEISTFSSTIAGGDFLGMFLIADGSDAASGDLLFSSLGANGGNDHAKMLGNNTFGFEDMVGLGDQDFNDMVVKVEVA